MEYDHGFRTQHGAQPGVSVAVEKRFRNRSETYVLPEAS